MSARLVKQQLNSLLSGGLLAASEPKQVSQHPFFARPPPSLSLPCITMHVRTPHVGRL